jgi:hypothetical protein
MPLTTTERARDWRKNNPEKAKAISQRYFRSAKGQEANRKQYIRRYGISQEDYQRLYVEQGGCCAICQCHQDTLSKRLFIDHCHDSGEVRGLLCMLCNNMLGLANDNPQTLIKAADYLKTYMEKTH